MLQGMRRGMLGCCELWRQAEGSGRGLGIREVELCFAAGACYSDSTPAA
jgi:hypothetical protein